MKTVLVTGANGQLGQCLRHIAETYSGVRFHFSTKEEFKVGDDNSTQSENVIVRLKPDYIVNAAAYTAVDLAETNVDAAYAANAYGVGTLAALCDKYRVKLIHISTDYVFDGCASRPYNELDLPDPQNVYGKSKLEGERLALLNNKEVIIVRTSWVYSPFGKNFVKTMLRLLAEKDQLNVVDDQKGSPTSAIDLAKAIIEIIRSVWTPGIYHYAGHGVTTWYGLAEYVGKNAGLKGKLLPIPTTEFPTPAKRPMYSVLDTSKIEDQFKIKIPSWQQSVSDCLTILDVNT